MNLCKLTGWLCESCVEYASVSCPITNSALFVVMRVNGLKCSFCFVDWF